MLKSGVIIDELPTIYFKGLDNLIATARSNKVAVCLGFQDFSQLKRDYGDKGGGGGDEYRGQHLFPVVGETAKTLSERFGKVLQQRQSMSIKPSGCKPLDHTQMDSLIPASKISTLMQGMFVGAVSTILTSASTRRFFMPRLTVDTKESGGGDSRLSAYSADYRFQ